MKKLICLVLAAIMLCALVGCNSVSQSDIDELQQRITQLEDKNKELEDELRDQKLRYEDKLTQQEKKFEDMFDNNQEIRFTAEAPAIEQNLPNAAKIKSFQVSADKEYFQDEYNEFVSYVQNDVKKKYGCELYLLNPQDVAYGEYPNSYDYDVYAVNRENSYGTEIYIHEWFFVYDEVLGDWYRDPGKDYQGGQNAHSVEFDLYLSELPQYYNKNIYGSLSLEFGKRSAAGSYYINLYIDSTCIGTCYYYVSANVSYKWFKNYFINNLF